MIWKCRYCGTENVLTSRLIRKDPDIYGINPMICAVCDKDDAKAPSETAKGANAALIMGILSPLFPPILPLFAVSAGHTALAEIKSSGRILIGRRRALVGMVIAYIVLTLFGFLFLGMVFRAIQDAFFIR